MSAACGKVTFSASSLAYLTTLPDFGYILHLRGWPEISVRDLAPLTKIQPNLIQTFFTILLDWCI